MKICVISARYSMTGVALAQTRLARAWAEDGHDVDLIFGALEPEQLPPGTHALPDIPGVRSMLWSRAKARQMLFPVIRYVRQERPDIVFSAEDHLNDIVLLAAILGRSKAKISASSRVFPLDGEGHRAPYSNRVLSRRWLFKQFTRLVSWRADAMTCVSRDMAEAYRRLFNTNRYECVYNIIVDDASLARIAEPLEDDWFAADGMPLIVSAGTLTVRKGFADLIRAVRALHDQACPIKLAILGEGPLRAELQAQIDSLGLTPWARLPGRVTNPLKYFARGDVSVLSSYSEGLPNVLVEAMLCGCTPVATDCPTGPREVLQDGRYGLLVPMHDPDAMAAAIRQALLNPVPGDLLREAVRPFERDIVLDRHLGLLGLADAAG